MDRKLQLSRDNLVAAQVRAEQARTLVLRARGRLEDAHDKQEAQRIADRLMAAMNDLNDLLMGVVMEAERGCLPG